MEIHNNTKVFKTLTILNKIDFSIKNQKSFGLVRFGDGGLKLIDSFINLDYKQIGEISKKEGIPEEIFGRVLQLWKSSANICDYIDSPEVYFSGKFWERTKTIYRKKMSGKTLKKLKNWKSIYESVGIVNSNYCNPEINFLMCLTKFGKKSLPDLLENKKICCITSREDVDQKLSNYKIDTIVVSRHYQHQYYKSFERVIKLIEKKSCNYDIWLVSAGELGRIYTGLIKFRNGRALDIGSLIDFWCSGIIPDRLIPYLQKSKQNIMKLNLTEKGKEFTNYI